MLQLLIVDLFKLRLSGSRKPSPEAERLQLLLHEKFVAQRRKDAIALQLSNGDPAETKALPTKKASEEGEEDTQQEEVTGSQEGYERGARGAI